MSDYCGRCGSKYGLDMELYEAKKQARERIADLESQLAAANVAITEWAMRLKGAQSELAAVTRQKDDLYSALRWAESLYSATKLLSGDSACGRWISCTRETLAKAGRKE